MKPEEMRAYDLDGYDGVLAFGETLSEVYRRWGWEGRVWTWHEAADTRLFHPPAQETAREGLVWIGNWGDGERTEELETFLFRPAQQAELPLDIYGVQANMNLSELLCATRAIDAALEAMGNRNEGEPVVNKLLTLFISLDRFGFMV